MNNNSNERAWYIIQSYTGMEYAAKRNLERRIHSMGMEEYIFNVLIPEKTHTEKKKNGELIHHLFYFLTRNNSIKYKYN